MLNIQDGTPFQGYVSLTQGVPGPVAFAYFVTVGQALIGIAPPAGHRAYITNITLSSNDAVVSLVTMDSGGTTPTKFVSAYLSGSVLLQPEEIPNGVLRSIFGVSPRMTAQAVSAGATVECIIQGYLSKT